MPKLPEIATYAASSEEVHTAILNGADHLILEDSKLSIRCYSHDYDEPHFEKINALAQQAKALNPKIGLSVNIDVMAHDYHFDTITHGIHASRYAGISEFRIQDPGLALVIKSLFADAQLTLVTETGNHNQESQRVFSRWFTRQTLGNELTHFEIATLTPQGASHFDIQVHGPILIQYSARRYMSGTKTSRGKTTRRLAQDLEYPGRYFPFFENPHGHFMYLYFDRCLIRYIPILMNLNIGRWIIDSRGESLEYLKSALSAYRTAAELYLKQGEAYQLPQDLYHHLETTGQRPLKAGFFLANKTDSEHRLALKVIQDTTQFIGTVVDVIRGKWITVELERSLNLPALVTLFSPEGPKVSFKINELFSLTDEPIDIASPFNRYVKMPWQKGAVPKSVLLLNEITE